MTIETAKNKEEPEANLKKPKPGPRPKFSDALVLGLLLLLELLLPVLIAFAGVGYLYANFNLWQYAHAWMLVLFGVAVTGIGLALSIFIDRLLAGVRQGYYKRGLKFGKSANSRMVKMGFGGLLIPILLVIAANLVTLPFSFLPKPATAMDTLISISARPVVAAPPEKIALLAMQSENPATKILSIQVLQGFRSPEGLAQLMRIASEDPLALSDGEVSFTLRKAIASYADSAIDPLLGLFKSIPADADQGAAFPPDLYERYFGQSFAGLEEEIGLSTTDEAERDNRLAQLEAAQAKLKENLAALQDQQPVNGDARLDFVMQTFIAIEMKQNDTLLAFAKATADNPAYSALVRGDALLLAAKLGDQAELDWLYANLSSENSILQTRALQAIINLQKKLSPTNP